MTLLATRHGRRAPRRHGHFLPITSGCALAAAAVTLVGWLLWPTWEPDKSIDPARLPVSVGGTLFNVPTKAVRIKLQRHSGPQERVDLALLYPSLEAPDPSKHGNADAPEQAVPP